MRNSDQIQAPVQHLAITVQHAVQHEHTQRQLVIGFVPYRKESLEKTTGIRCVIRIGNLGRIRKPTGYSIQVKDWNFTKQRPFISDKHLQLTRQLDALESKLRSHLPGVSSIEEAKIIADSLVLGVNPKKAARISPTFWQYFEIYIEHAKDTKKNITYRMIQTSRNNLLRFQETTGYLITWKAINLELHSRLLEFFQFHSKNTIGGSIIKNLKAVMEAAYIDGHHNNLIYKSKRFYKPSQKVQAIYLTEYEIQLLENYTGLSERLDNVRKLFLIEYYTGKRFSELQRLDLDEHLHGNILKFLQPKTGKMVTIPIRTKALRLMETSPRVISMQKYNQYLKELCRIVGITTMVVDAKKNSKVPKYKLVSSHAARRSFATNAWLAGIPIDHIQFMLGHSDVKTTHRYILARDEEKAKKIGEHPWLSG